MRGGETVGPSGSPAAAAAAAAAAIRLSTRRPPSSRVRACGVLAGERGARVHWPSAAGPPLQLLRAAVPHARHARRARVPRSGLSFGAAAGEAGAAALVVRREGCSHHCVRARRSVTAALRSLRATAGPLAPVRTGGYANGFCTSTSCWLAGAAAAPHRRSVRRAGHRPRAGSGHRAVPRGCRRRGALPDGHVRRRVRRRRLHHAGRLPCACCFVGGCGRHRVGWLLRRGPGAYQISGSAAGREVGAWLISVRVSKYWVQHIIIPNKVI